jgi:Kef-type K+ transport system membrane component KefB
LEVQPHLLIPNLGISMFAAIMGGIIPILLSLLVIGTIFRYPMIQAFTAGSSLSSTSFGTTLIALRQAARASTVGKPMSIPRTDPLKTKVGTILTAGAMMDDIVGLIMLSIIKAMSEQMASKSSGSIVSFNSIGKPILSSLGLVVIFPAIAKYLVGPFIRNRIVWKKTTGLQRKLALVFMLVYLGCLVAVADVAGTSRLLGAFIAGLSLKLAISDPEGKSGRELIPFSDIFESRISPISQRVLIPFFFASMGFCTFYISF